MRALLLGGVAAFCLLTLTGSSPGAPTDPQTDSRAEAEVSDGESVPGRDAVRRAAGLLQAGDLEGAITLLEPLAAGEQPPPVALAMLGALYLEVDLPRDALRVLQPLVEAEEADPAVLYNAGRAALQLGDAEVGERYLRRSVALVPVSPAARTLGLSLGRRGEVVAAYRLLRPWAEANPQDLEARQAAIVCALQLNRVPEAEELLEGMPAEDPGNQLLRADLLLRRRDAVAALAVLEPLAASHPPEMEVDVLQLMAKAYLETGQSALAVEALGKRSADHPELILALARAHYLGGDAEAALETLEPLAAELLATGPSVGEGSPGRGLAASVALEYGRFQIATGEPEEAVAALQRAADLDPWSSEVWQYLAQALAASGRREEAQAALERLQALGEARAKASQAGVRGQERIEDPTGRRLSEALEWMERGEPEQALDLVRQEIELAPRDPRPLMLEVRLLLAQGRREEALRSAERAVELAPAHPDTLYFRAVARMSLGEREGAEADLRRALELSPSHVAAMSDLALLLIARGERGEARDMLQRAVELQPDDEAVRRRLADLAGAEE